jgi:Flp pilus assembly protein TadD
MESTMTTIPMMSSVSWRWNASAGSMVCIAMLFLCGCSQTTPDPREFSSGLPRLSTEAAQGQNDSLTSREPRELVHGGQAYLAAGNPTLARLHFVTALQKNPELPEAFNGLGRAEYMTGNFPGALLNFEQATSLQPKNLDALLGQAQALRQMNKLDAAVAKINAAMKLAPDDYRVMNELAITYDLQGQERLAAPLYQELVRKAPDQAAVFNNLGINHLAQQQYAEAVLAFHRAYELDSTDIRIKNNLAMAFALHGSEDQALRLFTETVGEAAAWNNLGYLYMTQQRFDAAERALRKAQDLNPRYYSKAQENLERLNRLRQTGR